MYISLLVGGATQSFQGTRCPAHVAQRASMKWTYVYDHRVVTAILCMIHTLCSYSEMKPQKVHSTVSVISVESSFNIHLFKFMSLLLQWLLKPVSAWSTAYTYSRCMLRCIGRRNRLSRSWLLPVTSRTLQIYAFSWKQQPILRVRRCWSSRPHSVPSSVHRWRLRTFFGSSPDVCSVSHWYLVLRR